MPLLIGDPIVTDSAIIEQGQKLQAGAVLGMVESSGKMKLCAKEDGNGNAISDGSQNPYAVLLEDVDTSASDKIAPVLLMGQVDIGELSFGAGWEKESLKTALRSISIFAKQTL